MAIASMVLSSVLTAALADPLAAPLAATLADPLAATLAAPLAATLAQGDNRKGYESYMASKHITLSKLSDQKACDLTCKRRWGRRIIVTEEASA